MSDKVNNSDIKEIIVVLPSSPYDASPPPAYEGQTSPVSSENHNSGFSKSHKIAAGVGVGALVLVGGTAVAVASMLSSSGTHPYEVLPAGAIMYAEMDADPSANQKTAFLQLQDRLEKYSDGNEDIDAREMLSEPLGVDYDTQVEPWLGDRIGIAGYADAEAYDGLRGYFAYQIADQEALETVQGQFPVDSYVVDDYLVIPAVYDDEVDESEFRTPLTEDESFRSDIRKLGNDNVVTLWADLGGLQDAQNEMYGSSTGGLGLGFEEFSDVDEPSVSGRVAAGVHLESNVVELRAKSFDITVDGNRLNLNMNKGSVAKDMLALPQNSIAAFGVGGIDQVLNGLWDDYSDEAEEMAQEAEEYGIFLPEDFIRLSGHTLTGAVLFDGRSEPSFVISANGADEDLYQELLRENGYDTQDVEIRSEDGKVLISQGDVMKSKGTLADNEQFQQALPDLEDAQFAGYVDLDTVFNAYSGYGYEDDMNESPEYGSLGVTGHWVDGNGDLRLRWVLP